MSWTLRLALLVLAAIIFCVVTAVRAVHAKKWMQAVLAVLGLAVFAAPVWFGLVYFITSM